MSTLDDPTGDAPSRPSFTDLSGPTEPWWQRLRWMVGRMTWPPDRAVTRLAAVGTVAALAGAGAVWAVGAAGSGAAPAAGGLPLATRRAAPGAAGSSAPGTTAPVAALSPATTVAGGWVAIAGAVVRPGLYRAPADTRVSSLIAAAGGLTPDADADRINLAAPVRDGERVYVPRRGEAGAPAVVAGADGLSGGERVGPGGGPDPAGPKGPVNLNRSTAAELDTLPGVGPATARAIIEHREANGAFTSVEQLAEVRGIGPAKLEQLRPLVVV